ncbi:MAG: hypothetical protein ACREPV_10785 [Lysobacter sp.]
MPSSPDSLLRHCAMGLWFCAIAALGLLQFHARAFDDGHFAPNPVAWTWLGGSIVLAGLGLVLLIRAIRQRR